MSSPRPAWQSRRQLADVAIAATLLVMGMAEIWGDLPSRQGTGSRLWTSVAVVVTTVPLVFRRSRPLATVAAIGCALCLLYAAFPIYVLFYGTFVPVALATFSVARHGSGRTPFLGAAWTGLGLASLTVFVPDQDSVGNVVFNVGVLTLVWLGGWALAVFERREAAARRLAVETEVAASRLAATAVIEERTRIARELHDIVAHAVSVMVVQAGAAEPAVEDNPEFARAALRNIRTTGAGALAEMRRVVAMLRTDDDPQLLSPQPGVAALTELVEHARRTGLDATLTVQGTATVLPIGLDLAVYRIVQEALSNVRRHAAASRACVLLTYQPDSLQVEVSDDGAGARVTAGTAGHGLIGMRERAALYGGWLEASAGEDSGFTVRVSLPLAAA